jgi:hypothetical protein
MIPYSLFLIFLANRAHALKSRVAELVDLAAFRAGLQPLTRRGKTSKPPEPIEIPMSVDPAARV